MKPHTFLATVLATAAALALAVPQAGLAATSADYAQRNHLLIQWDGIDNVGTGTHDPAATTWKNIAPGASAYNLTLTADGGWANGKALSVNGISARYTAGAAPAAKTIEVVFKMTKFGRILLWGGNDSTRQMVCFDFADSNPCNPAKCYFTGRSGSSGPATYWNLNPTAIRSAAAVFANGASQIATDSFADGVPRTDEMRANNWANGGSNITIGGYGNDTREQYYWYGEVYAIRMYDTELSAAEIAANHAIDLERFAGVMQKPTSADYVQEGLVAQWDGIDNAGTGTHNAAAPVWKNLASTGSAYDLTLTANGSWNAEGNALVTTDLAATCASAAPAYKTIEVVFRKTDDTGRILLSGGDTRHMVIFDNDTQRVYFTSDESTKQILHAFNSAEVCSVAAEYDDNGVVATVFKDATRREDVSHRRSFDAGTGLSVGGRVAASTYGWKGEIYAIRLYSRRLSKAELARNYLVDCRRFLTSSSYIQKSLVAQWDGIDNAGFNLHDSTSGVWKNLSSKGEYYDLDVKSAGKWTDDALMCVGGGIAAQGTNQVGFVSFEAVVANGTNAASTVLFTGGNSRYFTMGIGNSEDNYVRWKNNEETHAFNNQKPGRTALAWLRDGATVLLNGAKVQYENQGGTWSLNYPGHLYVGARQDNSRPYNGDIFTLRAYSSNISDDLATYNYKVDRIRFGLPKRTFTWSGAVNEFFVTNGNWSIGLVSDGVPSVDDVAVLPTGNYTVSLDDEWVVGDLSVGAGATLALSLPRDGNAPDGAVPLAVMGVLSAESGAELALYSRQFDKWHHLETATLIECAEDSTVGLQTLAGSLNTVLGRNLASVSADGKRLVYTAPPPDGTVFIVR